MDFVELLILLPFNEMAFWRTETGKTIARNLLVYAICIGVLYFFNQIRDDRPRTMDSYIVVTIWYAWIFIHNRILIRGFLLSKRIVLYVVLTIPGLLIAAWLQYLLVNFDRAKELEPFSRAISGVVFYTIAGTLVFVSYLYLRERKTFFEVAAMKKEVELQQLKNQLNPHFLFNSLNNIYSYNLENNRYGNDLILKLSQLMRFILESNHRDRITVGEEISFIEDYISFEKERLGYRCEIDYVKEISQPERSIPPLLFFPFVENAFKHGTNSIGTSRIEIELNDSVGGIRLSVRNQIQNGQPPSTKTGLNNIARRLELLFPGRHKLATNRDNGHYSVTLQLEA